MTVTKIEKWIEPRATLILVIVSALVVIGTGAVIWLHLEDRQRIERLERVIRCQDTQGCRQFIQRAIRDFMRPRHPKPKPTPNHLQAGPNLGTGGDALQSPSGGQQPGPPKGGHQGGSKQPPKTHQVAPEPPPPASPPPPEEPPGPPQPIREVLCAKAGPVLPFCP